MIAKLLPFLFFFLSSFSLIAQDYPAYLIRAQINQEGRVGVGFGMCVPLEVKGKRLILTAYHVTDGAEEILVDLPVGWIRCKVVKSDKSMDLCLLEPKLEPPDKVEFFKGEMAMQQEVINPNYFANKKMTLQPGMLMGRTASGNWVARIEGFGIGSSGSPVYAKNGKLCGISSAGVVINGDTSNMAFAILIGIERIKEFLSRKTEE